MLNKRRDIDILNMGEKSLVIACDSCGGIGLKENDFLKVPPKYVGTLTTRVVLFEILSTGAKVISLSNAICNEMNSTGKFIIDGVKEELKKADISCNFLTGSTEENMPTTMTALGMTCVGILHNDDFKFKKAKKGDIFVLYGLPLVGAEINLDDDRLIAKYSDLYSLLEFDGTLEIAPTGSKGILYECEELSKLNNMKFKQDENVDIDLMKSCGVSTCLVVLVDKADIKILPKTSTPICVIGELI